MEGKRHWINCEIYIGLIDCREYIDYTGFSQPFAAISDSGHGSFGARPGNESELVISTPKSISMDQKHPNKQGPNLGNFWSRFKILKSASTFFSPGSAAFDVFVGGCEAYEDFLTKQLDT